jgi:hypothetical protein
VGSAQWWRIGTPMMPNLLLRRRGVYRPLSMGSVGIRISYSTQACTDLGHEGHQVVRDAHGVLADAPCPRHTTTVNTLSSQVATLKELYPRHDTNVALPFYDWPTSHRVSWPTPRSDPGPNPHTFSASTDVWFMAAS